MADVYTPKTTSPSSERRGEIAFRRTVTFVYIGIPVGLVILIGIITGILLGFFAARPLVSFSQPEHQLLYTQTLKKDGNVQSRFVLIGDDSRATISVPEKVISAPSWSADGTRFVYISVKSGHDSIYMIDLLDPEPRLITDDSGHKSDLVLSPNGQYIAYVNNFAHLYILDIQTMEQRKIGLGIVPSWSPDSTKLAFMQVTLNDGDESYVVVYDLPTSTIAVIAVGRCPVWSMNGRYIAFVQNRNSSVDTHIMLYDSQTGAIRIVSEFYTGSYNILPSWSPDGQYLGFVSLHSGQTSVVVYDAAFHPYTTYIVKGYSISKLSWSDDATEIVYGVWMKVGAYRIVVQPHRPHAQPYVVAQGSVFYPVFRPD